MSYFPRFSLLLACLVSVTLIGCRSETNSLSQSSASEQVQSLSPEEEEQVDTLVAKGNQKLADGEYQAAIAEFNQALAIDETNAEAFGYRGVARSRLEDYQGALGDYNQALALDSEAYEFYYNRGITQTHLKDYESAIEDFSETITYKPDFAPAFANRGFAYAEIENYKAAIDNLEKAAQLFEKKGNKRTSYRLQRAARYIQP